MASTTYYYLHGLASGPQSAKAKYLRDRFQRQGMPLHCPDFNLPSFKHLTLSRQIQVVESLIPSESPVTLIGSSLGGLTAAWVAQRNPQVERVILLAPAFEFLHHLFQHLGDSTVKVWQEQGYWLMFHYGWGYPSPLGYGFVEDLRTYEETALQRSLPTLILHGQQDRVIPLSASQRFASDRPWVALQRLDSDHSLGNASSQIWRAIQQFCRLN